MLKLFNHSSNPKKGSKDYIKMMLNRHQEINLLNKEEENEYYKSLCCCPVKYFCECISRLEAERLLSTMHICKNNVCDNVALGICLGMTIILF